MFNKTEYMKKYMREYRKSNPDKNQRIWDAKRYGYILTDEDLVRLYEEQEHRCAICGVHESDLKKRLAIDHCHETGEVRGLLCFNCNTGLGKLGDSVDGLQRALDYLLY